MAHLLSTFAVNKSRWAALVNHKTKTICLEEHDYLSAITADTNSKEWTSSGARRLCRNRRNALCVAATTPIRSQSSVSINSFTVTFGNAWTNFIRNSHDSQGRTSSEAAMIHSKRNKRKRAERMLFRKAVECVRDKSGGQSLRTREVERRSFNSHHPWAGFVKRESQFHSDEVYNLDVASVLFLAPRIRLLIKGGFEWCGATPCLPEFSNHSKTAWENWHGILKKIQYAFDALEDCVDDTGLIDLGNVTSEQRKKIDEGLLLFGKYMLYLTV